MTITEPAPTAPRPLHEPPPVTGVDKGAEWVVAAAAVLVFILGVATGYVVHQPPAAAPVPAPVVNGTYHPVVGPGPDGEARYRVELQIWSFYDVWARPGGIEDRTTALGPLMDPAWLAHAAALVPAQLPTGRLCCDPHLYRLDADGTVLYRAPLSSGEVLQVQGKVDGTGRFRATDVTA